MTPRHFRWRMEGDVGVVTLDRPERKNPLTFESYAELRDFFKNLEKQKTIKTIVITGAGGNFCSGGDVHEIIGPLTRMKLPELLEFTTMTGNLVKAMRHCPQPIIVVNSRSSGSFILVSGPMISCTSPPEQKLPPAPVITSALTLFSFFRLPKKSRSSAYDSKVSEFLRSGRLSVITPTAPSVLHCECFMPPPPWRAASAWRAA